jgi:hypothetical protein
MLARMIVDGAPPSKGAVVAVRFALSRSGHLTMPSLD